MEMTLDTETFTYSYEPNRSRSTPSVFSSVAHPYKLMGLIPGDIHLFGVDEPGPIFIFGTDNMGRDLFSRILFGGRISLTAGFPRRGADDRAGIVAGHRFGLLWRHGGQHHPAADRIPDVLPHHPAVGGARRGAATGLAVYQRYFAITVILSLSGWTGLARQVRAKVLVLPRDGLHHRRPRRSGARRPAHRLCAHAAQCAQPHHRRRHAGIPGMILAETSLSFLGLGILPPMVSWGALLQDAQYVSVILQHPWVMIPAPCHRRRALLQLRGRRPARRRRPVCD